jgi:hypothetical protein
MHEGCNARAWVSLIADAEVTLDLDGLCLLAADLPEAGRSLAWEAFRELPPTTREVFEPIVGDESAFTVRPAHNRILFYTWGDEECCLAAGATSATLVDQWVDGVVPPKGGKDAKNDTDSPKQVPVRRPRKGKPPAEENDDCRDPETPAQPRPRVLALRPGDVLIFEEVLGPRTGNPADADPARRQAVCITRVEPLVDAVCEQPVLHITWSPEDALPFPFCLSTQGPPPDCELLENVSVARGNVILVDHGLTCRESLGEVPLNTTEELCADACNPPLLTHVPGRFRPRLGRPALTFCEPGSACCPARDAMRQNPRRALPHIRLEEVPAAHVSANASPGGYVWTAVRDLLDSRREDRHFVAEVENDGRARLRFGNGESGRAPDACAGFTAVYRVGSGPAGNVGAEAIRHVVAKPGQPSGVAIRARNPLPAVGGTAAESMEDVKVFAPHGFRRVLVRAVTAADYSRIVERDFEQVQRATAALRCTGSHTEVLVAVDQSGVTEAEPLLLDAISDHLEIYRRIGHDVRVIPAVPVPLDLEIVVCVRPRHLRGHVEAAVRAALSAQRLADGTKRLFHPDRLSFGEGVYASKIISTVQALDGVESVRVARLERLFEGARGEIERGVLELAPFEIARLDSDPSFPENGRLTLDMRGGR